MKSDVFAAEVIEGSLVGFASLATARLLERAPELADRFGPQPFQLWRDHLAGRLKSLSTAVYEGSPQPFVDQVAWAKVAFASRRLPVGDVRMSVECLGEVLLEQLPARARPAVEECLAAALAGLDDAAESVSSTLAIDTPYGRLAGEYLLALLEGDQGRATALLLDAVRSGSIGAQDAMLRVCLPAQTELGRLWHMNEMSIAEEHFVSATTVTVLSQLLAVAPRSPSNGKVVLAAALENDQHDIGLRAVSHVFEIHGWRSVLLGSGMPVDELASAVEAFEADLVLLSAMMPSHRRAVARAIEALRASGGERQGVPVLVGGPAFSGSDELWRSIGAQGYGVTAPEAVQLARGLVGLPDEEDGA